MTGRQAAPASTSPAHSTEGTAVRKAVIMQWAVTCSALPKHKSRHPPPVGLLSSAKQHTNHEQALRVLPGAVASAPARPSPGGMAAATSSWTRASAVPHPGQGPGKTRTLPGEGEAGRRLQLELGDASLLTLHPNAALGSRGHRASPWPHSQLPSPLLHVGGSEGLCQGHLQG